MFKPIKRANKERKINMKWRAMEMAKEFGWTFTGVIENPDKTTYTAEFTAEDTECPFYGWAIEADDDTKEVDFVFGSGQQVFCDARYVITEEDYYETIGAGI